MTVSLSDRAVTEEREVPTADWVCIDVLNDDPYPIFRRLRAESPVHWVPSLDRYLVTGYDACHAIEQDAERFSADEDASLMKRSMGHSMLRKDDPAHAVDRQGYGSVLRPRAINEHWHAIFEANADTFLDRMRVAGPGCDLVTEFAAPYAAENLRQILGFRNASHEDMQRWSQTLINGVGNYRDDPDVWAQAERSSAEVDAAIEEMTGFLAGHPDHSLLCALLQSGLPRESLRANLKMTIGGGLNEPRDAIATTMWALLNHPDQAHQVRSEGRWQDAFEESIRWIAPIGMYPRQATGDTVLAGMRIPADARLGVHVGAGNRDPAVFADPEAYDVNRRKLPHLSFGGGAHFCAGAWVARVSVVSVALPRLFSNLPGVRLNPAQLPVIQGWVFRGAVRLPVLWDETQA